MAMFVASGPLAYPVVENNVVMEYSSLFTNIGPVVESLSPSPNPINNEDDDTIPASQLSHSHVTTRTTTSCGTQMASGHHCLVSRFHGTGIFENCQ